MPLYLHGRVRRDESLPVVEVVEGGEVVASVVEGLNFELFLELMGFMGV